MNSDMHKPGFATCLAQGAAGNAFATYTLLIGTVFYVPKPGNFFLVILLPIYLLAAGITGLSIGVIVWLTAQLLNRPPGIATRAAIGVLLPALIVTAVLLSYGYTVDWELLLKVMPAALVYSLPATLLAGSKFHPLRTIFLGSSRGGLRRDFAGGFCFPAALLLRVGSLLGLMASVLQMACLLSGGVPEWGIQADAKSFIASMIAILYFTASMLVCFALPGKFMLAITGILANAPLAIWAAGPDRYTSFGTGFLAFVVWVFVYMWVLLIAGRIISSENKERSRRKRVLPLTLWEIQIRQSLNRW